MFLSHLFRLALRGYRLELPLAALAIGAAWVGVVVAVNMMSRLLLP